MYIFHPCIIPWCLREYLQLGIYYLLESKEIHSDNSALPLQKSDFYLAVDSNYVFGSIFSTTKQHQFPIAN